MNILIYTNPQKDEGLIYTNKLAAYLRGLGAATYLCGAQSEGIEDESKLHDCDFVISLGGDGTFLRAAQKAYAFDVPIAGINLGRLGFMPSLEITDINKLTSLFDNSAECELRTVLDVEILRKEKVYKKSMCLNDAVVRMGNSGRILDIDLECNKQLVNRYRADGLIISTPTGSSAYSLSCGGPIVAPTVECILVTPVCPHTLTSRPLILDIDADIHVSVTNLYDRDAQLSLDGESGITLCEGDVVTAKTAARPLKVLKLNDMTYYELLSKKLKF